MCAAWCRVLLMQNAEWAAGHFCLPTNIQTFVLFEAAGKFWKLKSVRDRVFILDININHVVLLLKLSWAVCELFFGTQRGVKPFHVKWRTVVQWCQFVIVLRASWLQHVTFHHFPRLALCEALGWPAVYNTSHSACCSSMKFLFIEATGVQRVICLIWMRSGGFDKVSWIKALEGELKDRSQRLAGVRRPPWEDWLPLLYVMVNVSTLFS